MADTEEKKDLTEKQKRFCEEYIWDWNGSRAYKAAYPNVSDNSARVNASQLLTKTNIQSYISDIQKDIEKQANISRLQVIEEHKKIALGSIAHLHLSWIDRKDFENLTDDQKACIQEIDTQVVKRNLGTPDDPDIVDVERIKIKLYSKQTSLDAISKMLGYNEPEKYDHTTGGEQITGMIIK